MQQLRSVQSTGEHHQGDDHQVSKGLAFPVVAVVGGEGLNAGIETALAEDGAGVDVEARRDAARVLYVAATRASQQLILSVRN
ncbi:hypothetical protein [Simplicispira psychrophila]|uniref:hypothetical protein n=1 Tax=Simplicispira psychrophila TaxID=80882 RepID=UPI0012EBDAF5|nr:hypothetical protein [Simplicispira psychrophila]